MEPPAGFRYFDAHTHLHPPRLFAAIRRWFDEHSDWELRGPTEPDEVVAALRAAGVERFAFFSYAHRPGMARELNRWIRDTAARYPDGVPLGTVHAGDDDPGAVVDEACDAWGLAGLKLHTQVQRFHPDDPRLWPVYERLVALGRVLVIHRRDGTAHQRVHRPGALRAGSRAVPRRSGRRSATWARSRPGGDPAARPVPATFTSTRRWR